MNGRDQAIESLRAAVRDVPDFPKPGVVFKDITPILGNPDLLRSAGDLLSAMALEVRPERVVAIESRGFILGAMLAERLKVGFVPVRKAGKLPYRKVGVRYQLEYGEDVLEIHEDALRKGERALIVDDVLATGGTARAAGELVLSLGAQVVGYAFLIELMFLGGREKLGSAEGFSLLRY